MEKLSVNQESKLTKLQSREFLEERRGLYGLSDEHIADFCSLIYRFEKQLDVSFAA